MREITFLKEQSAKWQDFEKLLGDKQANPKKLAGLFIELTDDLSYARTNFPKSKTTAYLNGLAARAHQEIYKSKKENRGRIFTFWKVEVPTTLFLYRKQLLLSFVVFLFFAILGFVSEVYDENFVRFILGDAYVDATIDRIKNGNPLGIYGESEEGGMFIRITLHNILVSFGVYVSGIFFSFGTAYLLLRNGIMLGAFLAFFGKYQLLVKASMVIWIHGTFEISAIILAGMAGFVLGNSLLYPGSYLRLDSFKLGARRSLKIVIGIIPVFIVAGFLESFVTRYTNMPGWLSMAIIFTSLSCVIVYFIIYPAYLYRKINQQNFSNGKN